MPSLFLGAPNWPPPRRDALRELGVGPDRLLVVEVGDHRRVHLDGEQQLGEAAGDARPDRLVLERGGGAEADLLVDRDREVIGPELHQPLAERRGAGDGGLRARRGLGDVVRLDALVDRVGRRQRGLAGGPAGGALARFVTLLARGEEAGQHLAARGEPADLRRRLVRGAQLLEQPAARIAGDAVELARPGTEAEPVGRNRSARRTVRGHRASAGGPFEQRGAPASVDSRRSRQTVRCVTGRRSAHRRRSP